MRFLCVSRKITIISKAAPFIKHSSRSSGRISIERRRDMSERFSKKEFIKATRITFPSRRQILIFSGFILGIAVLFFVFPPERYPQTSNKWYIFMLSIYCIFLIRCLFRKTKEDSTFHRCPECGHPYPLENKMFEKTHDISVRLFLQEFTMILPDGKQISFAEDRNRRGEK